ncbi:hypothetical protein BZARG_780 [Bizionia argentinensis JUB59]|uniref:Cell wall anchor protein n=1 Tax=Bizionia argentinensis JUB59 TaxID=1046627 RepID=G2EB97_9FLAO|nr:hypothetical protein [Bizionia argentinensis]EGV44255.2 hypothetical protein BZARG_780 [Bizionia argentinensis JUB59]
MLEQILTYIIAPILTAVIAWYGSKAMTERHLKSKDLEIEIKSAEYYQGLLDDMSARLTQAVKELMGLEERYRELLKINADLIDNMKKYQQSNDDLIEELRKFKQLNGKVK